MIKVDNVTKEFVSTKKYPGFKGAVKGLFSTEKVKKTAVKNISFEINEGEMVGYIGSNGAGKSTSIKIMTGIMRPTEGNCIVNGIVPYEMRKENAKNIGVVFGQRTQLWWDLPLSETYTILKEVYSVNDTDYKERMEFLNEVLGLPEFMNSTVRTLSLGQRMRADLAAALLHNPKVLYLDEPTIGLDLVVKDKIREAIKEINHNYSTTVLLTTHDLGDIEELCNRIIIIDSGSIIYDGTINDIKETYGITRKVSLDIKDIQNVLNYDFHKHYGVNDKELSISNNGNTIEFVFNKKKLSVSEVIGKVMDMTNVSDIKIHETEISEIVKEIYKNGI